MAYHEPESRAVFFSVDSLTHVVTKKGEVVRVARPHAVNALRALYEHGVHLFVVRTAHAAEGETVDAVVRKAKGELIQAGIPLHVFRGIVAAPNQAKTRAEAAKADEAQSVNEYYRYATGWSGVAQAGLLKELLRKYKIRRAVSVAGEHELDHKLAVRNYLKPEHTPALKEGILHVEVKSPYEGRAESFKPHFERIARALQL